MMPGMFKITNAWDIYTRFIINTCNRVGKDKVEGIIVQNSSHFDQIDMTVYMEALMASMGTTQKATFEKKQGSQVQFHEFVTLAWVEFLYKIGHHDNTFTPYNFNERIT
jgi:hypothetical protein